MGIKIEKANDLETHFNCNSYRVVKTTLKNKLNFVLFTMVELDLRLICQHKWQNHIFDLFAPKWTFAAGKNDRHTDLATGLMFGECMCD